MGIKRYVGMVEREEGRRGVAGFDLDDEVVLIVA